jgi:hypothetical protein
LQHPGGQNHTFCPPDISSTELFTGTEFSRTTGIKNKQEYGHSCLFFIPVVVPILAYIQFL